VRESTTIWENLLASVGESGLTPKKPTWRANFACKSSKLGGESKASGEPPTGDRDRPRENVNPNINIASLRPVGAAVPSGAAFPRLSPQTGGFDVWT